MKKKRYIIFASTAIIIIIGFYILGFRIIYFPSLVNDWNAIAAVGTWIGVLSTTLLTILIIKITKKISDRQSEIQIKLSEQQIELQKSISEQQEQIQKYSIKSSLYNERIKVYEAVYIVLVSIDSYYTFICENKVQERYKIVLELFFKSIDELMIYDMSFCTARFLFDEKLTSIITDIGIKFGKIKIIRYNNINTEKIDDKKAKELLEILKDEMKNVVDIKKAHEDIFRMFDPNLSLKNN